MEAQFFFEVKCRGCNRVVNAIANRGFTIGKNIFFLTICPVCFTRKIIVVDKQEFIDFMEEK